MGCCKNKKSDPNCLCQSCVKTDNCSIQNTLLKTAQQISGSAKGELGINITVCGAYEPLYTAPVAQLLNHGVAPVEDKIEEVKPKEKKKDK